MSLLNHLKELNPLIEKFYSQDVFSSDGQNIGKKYVCADSEGNIISGGTAQAGDLAKRIAIAEAFERSYLSIIRKSSELREKFMWDQFPSSSGFAAGFDRQTTRFRSICEGLERWSWSQWVDKKYILPSLNSENLNLCPLAKELARPFDKTFWFKKNFQLVISNEESFDLSFVVFLGCFKNGIFAGSRVST